MLVYFGKIVFPGLSQWPGVLGLMEHGQGLVVLRPCCNEEMNGRCGGTKEFPELQRSAEAAVVVAGEKT